MKLAVLTTATDEAARTEPQQCWQVETFEESEVEFKVGAAVTSGP